MNEQAGRPCSTPPSKDHQQQLAETNRLMNVLDYLFFSLAHEMGNPINSIKMTLEVLINNFDTYSQETRLEYLGNLHAEFSRLEELLKAIRSFNIFEHLSIKATNMQPLLQNLLQMLQNEIGEKNISMTVSFPGQPVWAACDPRALHQSLLNIISNAIDALSGCSDPVIAVFLEGDEARCRIRITDNGCGIPAGKQEDVFMPFFSSKHQGIGLGLTMVKKLVTRMNGSVDVTGLEPRGTEVLITLPILSPHGN
jgi:signal transduction histidine kinase